MRKIIVFVHRGIVECADAPDNVVVELHDYDINEIEENNPNRKYGHDLLGDYKVSQLHISHSIPAEPQPSEPDKVKPHPNKAKRQDCANCLYPERSCSQCINKAKEPKPLAQYLNEYIEHEIQNGNIEADAIAGHALFLWDSWCELLEQALDAYESTEQVKIRIEPV